MCFLSTVLISVMLPFLAAASVEQSPVAAIPKTLKHLAVPVFAPISLLVALTGVITLV